MRTVKIVTPKGLHIKIKVVQEVIKYIEQVSSTCLYRGEKAHKINNIIYLLNERRNN